MSRLHPPAIRLPLVAFVLLSCGLLAAPSSAAERVALHELDINLQADIEAPLRARLAELANSKDEVGAENKRGSYSRLVTRLDDSTYEVSMVVKTAGVDTLLTEQLLLTVAQDGSKSRKWTITDEKSVRTYDELHREVGYTCYPFESFAFERWGLKVSASKGNVCETYYEDDVSSFVVVGSTMDYAYTPPQYLDYYQTYGFLKNDYSKELLFSPKGFEFECDPRSCEEILDGSFTGLSRRAVEARTTSVEIPADIDANLRAYVEKQIKERDDARKSDAFSHFRRRYTDDRRRIEARVAKNLDEGLGVTYDNWDGFEITFWVEIQWPNVGRFVAPVYGYYTQETLAANDPYDLERRDDLARRFYDLTSVKGAVEAGLDDPEILRGDVEFGVHVRQPTKVIEFAIATLPRENVKRPSLFINSVEYQDQDLLWVQTSPFSGIIVFPEELQAGQNIDLRIVFSSRAIEKVNHAFSRTPRGSWLPLVTFGDFIDEFELELTVLNKFTPLGVGTKVSEKTEGDRLITQWVADNPVEFPSIIFGKYKSDASQIEAQKLDGTPIPVNVYVDEVSMGHVGDVNTMQDFQEFSEAFSAGARGIRGSQLRPIADQAAGAIQLYTEISGVDYPYGELNLVNDPAPALYGQAPSSLIYLGSLVFRGEGTMAGDSILGGGGTQIAKFLKSVVAHEVGHQWWGSRVANSNGRNYWFVESLAEFFSAIYLERVYGPKEYQEQVDEWRRAILNRDMRASVQNASALWPGEDFFGAYQAAVYNKGPYAFHMLRQIFGDEKFFPALKQFCLELTAKGEIVTRDIQMAAEKAFGGIGPDGNPYNVDLSWFFDQWIRGTGLPQYAFTYDVRQTEDGGFLIEGTIKQRVVVGSKGKYHVMDGVYYRGIVPVTVKGKKNQFASKIVVEGAETQVRLRVPERPVEVLLNDTGVTLAHDPIVGWDFK